MVIAPDAEDRCAALHAALDADGVEAAGSAWEGKLVVRCLSVAPHRLRQVLARALVALRRAPLPRSWTHGGIAA